MKFKRVLRNKIQIENDDENDNNAQNSSTTMTLWSKYTPFKYCYLVKKGPNQPGRGQPPTPPLNGQCPFKKFFFHLDAFPYDVHSLSF